MIRTILRRSLGAAAGLALCTLLVAAWREPQVPIRLKAFATALAVISAVSPPIGLCLVAGLVPMAFPLEGLAGIATTGTVIGELLAIGFLAGVVPRLSFSSATANRLAQPALILGALAAASAVVLLSGAWQTFVSAPRRTRSARSCAPSSARRCRRASAPR